jgi:hypothetical protein
MRKMRVLKYDNGLTAALFRAGSRNGMALAIVAVITLIFTLLGLSVLSMVNNEIAMARQATNKAKAFYLAEAGVEVLTAKLVKGEFAGIDSTSLGEGSYDVQFFPDEDPPYAISTGTVAGQEKKIKVTLSFLAPPYECGIYAGGLTGLNWTFRLRGTGNPIPKSGGEVGGKDTVNGNIFVDGDVALYQESCIRPPVGDNPFNLQGDVFATGDVDLYDSATIAGDINEGYPPYGTPDLVGMEYAVNNTHNVSQIFAGQTIDSRGRLPVGHPLREVFRKNPTYDRSAECASTTGDDFFFEPASGFIGGSSYKDAPTPLHAGNNRIYYIDGNLWVNSKSDTYGFNMDGKVTIVVTGNIYICDNLKYADANSMLGLVALGKYDANGDLISGGNIIFGDPTYGTMYIFSAMMFAANDFLFNSKTLGNYPKEPESGFTITGNLAALNHVSIERDWYDKWNGYSYTARPARYDPATNKWYDSGTGAALTSTEISSMRHYQMVINYDDRVRTQNTQPPGLPRGTGLIFDGITKWEEL